MSDDVLLQIVKAICTGVPAAFFAWRGLRQGKSNGRKADASKAVAEVTADGVAAIGRKAEEIHDLTNSAFAAIKGELVTVKAENAVLRQEKAELLATVAALSGKERRQ